MAAASPWASRAGGGSPGAGSGFGPVGAGGGVLCLLARRGRCRNRRPRSRRFRVLLDLGHRKRCDCQIAQTVDEIEDLADLGFGQMTRQNDAPADFGTVFGQIFERGDIAVADDFCRTEFCQRAQQIKRLVRRAIQLGPGMKAHLPVGQRCRVENHESGERCAAFLRPEVAERQDQRLKVRHFRLWFRGIRPGQRIKRLEAVGAAFGHGGIVLMGCTHMVLQQIGCAKQQPHQCGIQIELAGPQKIQNAFVAMGKTHECIKAESPGTALDRMHGAEGDIHRLGIRCGAF